jgi:hypothetical protein
MRILFLSQGTEVSDHPGWHNALIKLKSDGDISYFENIPYLGYAEKFGWEEFYNEIIKKCKIVKFDIVYFHYFHGGPKSSPQKCIQTLLNLNERPIIITSCGDGFSDNWMRPDYPEDFKVLSKLADITFSTQMGKAADKMIKWGAKNIVYSPNSMCQVRFKAHNIDPSVHQFDFNVVFVGSYNSGRVFNPVSQAWYGSRKRIALVTALNKRYGNKLGLFGKGWSLKSAQGPIHFNDQQSIFQRGRIIVGGNPYSFSDYYSSNRLFFAVSSGIPVVELEVPRLNKILRNNHHVYFEHEITSLIDKVDKLLECDVNELYWKSSEAASYIQNFHTQYHRMKFKIDTVKRYMDNNYKLNVRFPFFLPEVDLEDEKKYAIRYSNK